MSFYVEVMCNERKQGVDPTDRYRLRHLCYSDRNDNPQGRDLKGAATEARKAGWTVRGRYACCPGCKQ